ncbi:MAG: hypothetical protein WC649_12445 [Desulfobacteria bacterium]
MISPFYGYRQTQTALSVRYLLEGSSWFAYETPLVGPPWSTPMEFPLYQWVVALVVKSGMFPLDQAGKFVSEMFFLTSLYPLFKILGIYELSKRQRYLILVLYCMSPLYVFWSRSFLIESTVLSLSMYYLWFVVLYLKRLTISRAGWHILAGIALTGSLAGMVKVTTFFAFLVCSILAITSNIYNRYSWKEYRNQLLVLILVTIFVPFLATYSWTTYADSVKALNPLAKGLTSHGVYDWVFGTVSQRLNPDTWKRFYSRTVYDLTGNSVFATICIASIVLCGKKRAKLALVSLGFFLITQITFTNLHNVHSYYPYANGIFLIVAIGIIITDLLESQKTLKRITGLILFCVMIFFCTKHFFSVYWEKQDPQFDFSKINNAVDAYTQYDDVFIIFSRTLAPEIPYHIRRKAVTIPTSLNEKEVKDLKERLKNYRIGGFLFYNYTYGERFDAPSIEKALSLFDYKPERYCIFPWILYNSEIFIFFNGNKEILQ